MRRGKGEEGVGTGIRGINGVHKRDFDVTKDVYCYAMVLHNTYIRTYKVIQDKHIKTMNL